MNSQKRARERLHHDRGGGEDSVGDHHHTGGVRDCGRIARSVRHPKEEGDAEPGAEQHRTAEQMNELERKIERHVCSVMNSQREKCCNANKFLRWVLLHPQSAL
jgi:hypothetical protein